MYPQTLEKVVKTFFSLLASTSYAAIMMILGHLIFQRCYWEQPEIISTLFLFPSPLGGILLRMEKGKFRLTLLAVMMIVAILLNIAFAAMISYGFRNVYSFNEALDIPMVLPLSVIWVLMWFVASIFPFVILILEYEFKIYPKSKSRERKKSPLLMQGMIQFDHSTKEQ
jgi:ABC-type Na+ efflux pump permease subunit